MPVNEIPSPRSLGRGPQIPKTGYPTRACVSCRSMKMKCEGADDPPCVRCRKAGRDCIPQVTSLKRGLECSTSVLSGIPSIFSASPMETVESSPRSFSEASPGSYAQKRMRFSSAVPSTPGIGNVASISRRDMKDMLLMFRERLLPHLSIFEPDYFKDPDHILDTNPPLVICACYTTARYLHNGKAVQTTLLPDVLCIIRGTFHQAIETFALLQILMILIIYSDREAPSTKAFELESQGQLKYWSLKYRIELCALELGLHRSVQGFTKETMNGGPVISSMVACRNYLYWLQLSLMSHYYSIICGTPPNIRIDSSIRAAPGLLRRLASPQYNRLLGEIELCLIWQQASHKLPQTGEWWCPPDIEPVSDSLIEEVILETDHGLDAWYTKWVETIQSGEHHEFILDYHYRFTRFYISSYSIRCLTASQSASDPQSTTPPLTLSQQIQVSRCMYNASHVLEWVTSMPPIQKDRLHYLPGSSTTMVSFCCLFYIAICQNFTWLVESMEEGIERVVEVARLMIRLAVDEEHKPWVYGSAILARVEVLRKVLDGRSRNETGTVTSGRGNGAVVESRAEVMGTGSGIADTSDGWSHEFDFGAEVLGMESFWNFPVLYGGEN